MGIMRVGTTHVGEGCDSYTRAAVAGDKTRGAGVGNYPGCKESLDGVWAVWCPDWGYWGNYSLSQIKNRAMLNVICGPGLSLNDFSLNNNR